MTISAEQFKECRHKYADPHEYKQVWERALWTLSINAEEDNNKELTCSEIAQFLTDIVEIDTSPQAVRYALNNLKKGLVKKNKTAYRIMEKGKRALFKESQSQIYVKAGSTFTSKEILGSLLLDKANGDLMICDPYVGPRTLDIISKLKPSQKIQILTSNIQDKPKGIFLRTLADLKEEGYNIEIKVYDKSILHDRYVINNDSMWVVGHSLKDLGKKECFIYQVGADLRASTKEMFVRRWKVSNQYD